MLQKGREVRSRTDYILGTDRRLFGNVSVWEPRHNSDHYTLMGCLPSASLMYHNRYLVSSIRDASYEAYASYEYSFLT